MDLSPIAPADITDLHQLVQLVNRAYRGEAAKKGWTHEADLIDGTVRTDASSLERLIKNPDAVVLKYSEAGKIVGCVYLEKQGDKLYLGMLSVDPEIQARGIGKTLLRAAEVQAKKIGCALIEMTVISVRKELIAWYERNGYHETGIIKPFPNDGRFGEHRQPLQFIVLEKEV
ncbi:MAG TPA: GNAT family N-acetyltransferase [Flavisolibacter sp.]|nr:GNAT family N-acetyltransferase [Flavisolibacter sp.]